MSKPPHDPTKITTEEAPTKVKIIFTSAVRVQIRTKAVVAYQGSGRLPLVWYCHFDVSPVNYSDSDSDSEVK